jgi:hypothetical protein
MSRNQYAKELANPKYRQRAIKDKKKYTRKNVNQVDTTT